MSADGWSANVKSTDVWTPFLMRIFLSKRNQKKPTTFWQKSTILIGFWRWRVPLWEWNSSLFESTFSWKNELRNFLSKSSKAGKFKQCPDMRRFDFLNPDICHTDYSHVIIRLRPDLTVGQSSSSNLLYREIQIKLIWIRLDTTGLMNWIDKLSGLAAA